MFTIISRQEIVKRDPRKKNLHEWMCFAAEDVVKHNWTDVAIHDRKILEKMRHGETRLWAIYELGSAFLPMYCRNHENKHSGATQHEFSAVEVFLMRFFKEHEMGQVEASFRKHTKFYFITKGSSDYDYTIIPTTIFDVVDLVFCGQANHLLNQS
ncbi:MAG: hypothetical protein RLZZ289_1743 [Bacteroidota bacterium]